jgi:hypothetical protein
VSPNKGETRRSDSTTQIGILYFLENALVSEVFPVPGGPYSNTVKFGANFVSFNSLINLS